MAKTGKRILAVVLLILTVLLVGCLVFTGNRLADYPKDIEEYKRATFIGKDGTMVAFTENGAWYSTDESEVILLEITDYSEGVITMKKNDTVYRFVAIDDKTIYDENIREEDILYDSGNFPMRSYGFFSPAPEYTRFAHILDFDVLRLGKKVIANNPKAGSFEFGVVVITEIGKERANMLELKEMKKNADEANQKNDLFNAWLKMCRHSATVDNFLFIKVFVDEQRPESWGADARELADILYVANSGKPKLALPFYTIEEILYDWAFSRFISMYYNFRHIRGDNTLFVYILKCLVSKIGHITSVFITVSGIRY